jgi:hypothetical protein
MKKEQLDAAAIVESVLSNEKYWDQDLRQVKGLQVLMNLQVKAIQEKKSLEDILKIKQ